MQDLKFVIFYWCNDLLLVNLFDAEFVHLAASWSNISAHLRMSFQYCSLCKLIIILWERSLAKLLSLRTVPTN